MIGDKAIPISYDQREAWIQEALHLIKIHIEPEDTHHNRDLHTAVQRIVDFARQFDHAVR